MRQTLCSILALWLLLGVCPAQTEVSALRPGVTVIGASVSAGFGSGYDLAETLQAGLGPQLRVVDHADSMLFLAVAERGARMVAAARTEATELVIAIDHLFWYASGRKDLETRKRDVRAALDDLASLPGRVVVGALPDMQRASPLYLLRSRRIPEEELGPLNEWLAAEIAGRSRLRLVRVDRWMAAIEAGSTLPEFEEVGLREPVAEELMARDGLHLSRRGLVLATALLLADLERHELAGRSLVHDVATLEQRLAQADRRLAIRVFDPEGRPAGPGRLRFDLPDVAEMRAAGLELGELVKLRPLRRYARPLDFESGAEILIADLPASAARLRFRVRAEQGDEFISRWHLLDLDRAENRVDLALEPAPTLAVKVLDGPEALALPGALVAATEEIEGRGLALRRLSGRGPGYATTDEHGWCEISGLGPDAARLLVRRPDGSSAEFALDREARPQVLRLPLPEPEPEPAEGR